MKTMVGWFVLMTGLAFSVLITGFIFLLLEMQVFDKMMERRKQRFFQSGFYRSLDSELSPICAARAYVNH